MTLFTRRQAIATLGAATAVGLAAPALAQNRKITLGALRFTSHAGSFVGFERDYFKEAGLDVELRFGEHRHLLRIIGLSQSHCGRCDGACGNHCGKGNHTFHRGLPVLHGPQLAPRLKR